MPWLVSPSLRGAPNVLAFNAVAAVVLTVPPLSLAIATMSGGRGFPNSLGLTGRGDRPSGPNHRVGPSPRKGMEFPAPSVPPAWGSFGSRPSAREYGGMMRHPSKRLRLRNNREANA